LRFTEGRKPVSRQLFAQTTPGSEHALCRFAGKAVVNQLAVGSDEDRVSRSQRQHCRSLPGIGKAGPDLGQDERKVADAFAAQWGD
jgi:hypothetical protein